MLYLLPNVNPVEMALSSIGILANVIDQTDLNILLSEAQCQNMLKKFALVLNHYSTKTCD